MTYHHPGVPSAVRWCERVPCWQRLLRWQHWTLKMGGTHTNTARFWTLSSDTIAHWWLMITHTLTRWRWWRDAPPHAKFCFLLLFSAGSGSKNRYDNLVFFFCFRGALASLPGNLINFSLFHVFSSWENFTAHYFWKTWLFCKIFLLCTPFAFRHLAPFVWQIPSVKREISDLYFPESQ